MNDLLDFILSVFGLSADAVSTLVESIKSAILSSIRAAYDQWCSLTGAVPALQPDRQTIEQQATAHADSIVATYSRELGNATETYLSAWQQANGSLDGVEGPLVQMLSDWSTARLQYKAVQIAGFEVGFGADLGTAQFVQDLLTGALIDTTTGEVLSPDEYGIGVIPGESSSDFCKDYAGRLFGLDEIDNIPAFPAHANCKHERIIVPLSGAESEYDYVSQA